MICGSICCTAAAEEDMGIYLLPGEEKIHDRNADWLTWGAAALPERDAAYTVPHFSIGTTYH